MKRKVEKTGSWGAEPPPPPIYYTFITFILTINAISVHGLPQVQYMQFQYISDGFQYIPQVWYVISVYSRQFSVYDTSLEQHLFYWRETIQYMPFPVAHAQNRFSI